MNGNWNSIDMIKSNRVKIVGIPKERRIYKPSYNKKEKMIEIDLKHPL